MASQIDLTNLTFEVENRVCIFFSSRCSTLVLGVLGATWFSRMKWKYGLRNFTVDGSKKVAALNVLNGRRTSVGARSTKPTDPSTLEEPEAAFLVNAGPCVLTREGFRHQD